MSDESSEQLSAADTSKNEAEVQSDEREMPDSKKIEDTAIDDQSENDEVENTSYEEEELRAKDAKKIEEKEAIDDQDDDDEDDEANNTSDEEELPAGLLEKPVIIEDGKKRERKKVERITFETAPKKKIDIEIKEGKGRSLGDIPFIEYKLNRAKSEDCKPLHRLLFKRSCTNFETKRQIRQFSGFPFSKDDKEYEKRLEMLKKYSLAMIRKIMEILDIPRGGTKIELMKRLMEWLEKPEDSNRKVPESKRKRSSTGGKKKVKKSKKKKSEDTTAGSDNEVKDSGDDAADDDDDKDDDKADSSDDEEEEEKSPPKKKVKKSTPKPAKEKKQRTPKPTNKRKVTPKKKKEFIEDEDDITSSDEEPLAVQKKKSKGPPTNDELKDVVKKMLDNANLEQVTMKTVLKNVFEKYPEYDLLDRKDFIKNTVKQIIS